MEHKKRILAVIPARGGSKSVPNKNIKNLAGKPLICYTIELAKKIKAFNKVVVSTDSEDIAKISRASDSDVVSRPAELSTDISRTEDALLNVLKYYDSIGEKFDIVNIGDVIEHVNDPVKLILFAKRHLKENGKIIVSTPNPYFYKHIYRCVRETTFIANFEHTFWITPSMALEISRRSGVSFSGYIFFSSKNKFKAYIQKLLPEIFYGDFTYIFDKNK